MKWVIDGTSQEDKRIVFEKISKMRNRKYDVEIKEHREETKASSKQVGYYFAGIVKPLSEFFGIQEWEVNEGLRNRFTPYAHLLPNGEMLFVAKHRKTMEGKELTNFIDQILEWALREFDLDLSPRNKDDLSNLGML